MVSRVIHQILDLHLSRCAVHLTSSPTGTDQHWHPPSVQQNTAVMHIPKIDDRIKVYLTARKSYRVQVVHCPSGEHGHSPKSTPSEAITRIVPWRAVPPPHTPCCNNTTFHTTSISRNTTLTSAEKGSLRWKDLCPSCLTMKKKKNKEEAAPTEMMADDSQLLLTTLANSLEGDFHSTTASISPITLYFTTSIAMAAVKPGKQRGASSSSSSPRTCTGTVRRRDLRDVTAIIQFTSNFQPVGVSKDSDESEVTYARVATLATKTVLE